MKRLGEETLQLANDVETGKKAFIDAAAQLATGKPKPSSKQPPPNVSNQKPVGKWNTEPGKNIAYKPEEKEAKPEEKPVGRWNK